MSVQYHCDVCGNLIQDGEALQKKVTFVGKSSTFMAVAYMPDKKDYCLSCAQSEAAPFRRKRGRPTIVEKTVARDPNQKSNHWS